MIGNDDEYNYDDMTVPMSAMNYLAKLRSALELDIILDTVTYDILQVNYY